MATPILSTILSSNTIFSTNVIQPPQDLGDRVLSALLNFPQSTEPSTEFLDSGSSPIIETIGVSTNVSYLLPSSNDSNSVYDQPYEYPDLGPLETSNDDLQCKGESFGFNLSRTSCSEVFNHIPNSDTLVTWGQRGQGNFQAKLPFRISSSDGFCAIDIVHARNAVSDFASGNQIKQAAARVIQGCVKNGPPNTGGLVRNIGQNRNLVVIARLYIPNVQCRELLPNGYSECRAVVDGLPVTTESLVFGRQGDPSTRVIIPRTLRAAYRRCTMRIKPPADLHGVTTRWFDVWQAAESIRAMCGRMSWGGEARNIGGSAGLVVVLDGKPGQ